MRVTLVHAPRPEHRNGRLERTFIMIMPVGLLGLADHLDRQGHQVEVIHLGLTTLRDPDFDLARHLEQRRPGMVGFTLHWHHQLASVLHEAERAHRVLEGEGKIVLGGFTASALGVRLLGRFPFIDHVVRGDGEAALTALAAGAPPEAVPNLIHRDEGEVVQNPITHAATSRQLDELDPTRLDLLRDADLYSAQWFLYPGDTPATYAGGKRVFYLAGGRGCTVNCTFCGGSARAHRALGRHGIALRSPERLAEDALKVAAAGYETLYLCFDPPGLPADHYPRFFALVRRLGLRLSMIFECYGLPEDAFLDDFARTFEPRHSQLAFSPDSADERVRQRHKGYSYSNADLERCLEACARRGVKTSAYFTLMPDDGPREVERLRDYQDRLRKIQGCQILTLPIEVEPGAAWQQDPRRFGLTGGPYDLDHFLRRHRAISTLPGPERWYSEDVEAALAALEA